MMDDDVPAGYRDADIEQAELEQLGRASAAARRRGDCPHGWRQGLADIPAGRTPDDYPDALETCLDCGKQAPHEQLERERCDALEGRRPARREAVRVPDPGRGLTTTEGAELEQRARAQRRALEAGR